MDPNLEDKFIKFTSDFLNKHKILPKYFEIKEFYDSLTFEKSNFKASKGWFEKFVWRNYQFAPRYHYKRSRKRKSELKNHQIEQNQSRSEHISINNIENMSARKSKFDENKSVELEKYFRKDFLKTIEFALENKTPKRDFSINFEPENSKERQSGFFQPNFESSHDKTFPNFLNLSKMSENDIQKSLENARKSYDSSINRFHRSSNLLENLNVSMFEPDSEARFKYSILKSSLE